jgi:hypothetical protein
MTEQTNDECRKEFEDFMHKEWHPDIVLDKISSGRYKNSTIDAVWQGFKEGYNRATPQADSNLNLSSAIASMIGYCESLKVGTVITEGYVERMKNYYVPKLQEAIAKLRTPQADKPAKAWKREELLDVLMNNKDVRHCLDINIPLRTTNVIITALSDAGVIKVEG